MSDLFDFDKPPPLYAVMGNPITHSRSPEIHQLFAEQTSIKINYQRIQVDVGGFAQAVSNFQASGGRGLNVTVPFKVEAWELCDVLAEHARSAHAVNTLWFDGTSVHGDNTDGTGIVNDIQNNLDCPISGKRLLVLGAGGAVRGVLGQLLTHRPISVVIANRTVDKAVELSERFRPLSYGLIQGCSFQDVKGLEFDIVINGTSASLSGQLPPLPRFCISNEALAYDIVYSKQPTAFMEWAEGIGFNTISDGLGMLVEQAAESFYIWHNRRPQTQSVIRTLRSEENTD